MELIRPCLCGRWYFGHFLGDPRGPWQFLGCKGNSGKSKQGLSKRGLGPKGADWVKKSPFGAISALSPVAAGCGGIGPDNARPWSEHRDKKARKGRSGKGVYPLPPCNRGGCGRRTAQGVQTRSDLPAVGPTTGSRTAHEGVCVPCLGPTAGVGGGRTGWAAATAQPQRTACPTSGSRRTLGRPALVREPGPGEVGPPRTAAAVRLPRCRSNLPGPTSGETEVGPPRPSVKASGLDVPAPVQRVCACVPCPGPSAGVGGGRTASDRGHGPTSTAAGPPSKSRRALDRPAMVRAPGNGEVGPPRTAAAVRPQRSRSNLPGPTSGETEVGPPRPSVKA